MRNSSLGRAPPRIAALDLLRGAAVGAMLFSGQLPRAVLPGWMYHAQNPPPSHAFNPALPGVTWVDLVFPLFLFALGAAIPLAMGPKLGAGQSRAAAAAGVLRRALLLALFAIAARHFAPHVAELGAPWLDACYALAGLGAMFAVLAPCPAGWSPKRRLLLRAAGWGAGCALLFLFRDAQGAGFSPARSDIILLVMANVSLSAGLLYLCTRHRPWLRLVLLVLLLALRLGKEQPGWAHWLWEASPVPWLAPLAFQQYLFVVVPGMFAGEWLARAAEGAPLSAPSAAVRRLAALCCLGLVAICTAGLYARAQLGLATLALLVLAVGGARWVWRQPPPERSLYALGLVLMLLGLAFDPLEGGTQKGVATLSYYLVGAAAGSLLLLALLLAAPRRGLALALWSGTGQNALFAYVGLHLLVTPLLVLSGLTPVLQAAGPAAGSLRALLLTVLVFALAWIAQRRRLPLRV